jgi:PAS domain S-box-containing protein
MRDEEKSRDQLLKELGELRQRLKDQEIHTLSDQVDSDRTRDRLTEALGQSAKDLKIARAETAAGKEALAESQESLRISEQNLDAFHERYNILGDLIPFGIWTADAKGNITFLSDAFLEMTGMTNEETGRLAWVDQLAKPVVKTVISEWSSALHQRDIWESEFTAVSEAGNKYDLLIRGIPILDDEERILSWLGINLDISHRKQAEENLHRHNEELEELVRERSAELAHSESLYRSIAASLPNAAVFIIDADMRYLLAEGSGLRDAGVEPADLEGKTIYEALPRELAEKYEPLYRSALAGESVSWEHAAHCRHYISHLKPIVVPGEQIQSALAVSYDITERKRAEDSLEKANRKLQTTIDSITDGLLIIDRDWRYTFVSETAARIIRMRSEDLLGKSVWELFPYAKGTKFFNGYHRAVETGKPVAFDEFYPEPLNMWLECHCVPGEEGLSVYFRDITDRKRIEEELQHTIGIIQGITKGTEDLIAAQDSDFRYIYFNDAYRREFKKLWGQEITIGTSMVEAMALFPEEQAKARDLWQRALNGESYGVTMEFGPSEREKQVYDLRFNPVLDAIGRQIGAAHILRNVTKQVRLREELHHRAAELDAALESLAEGVVFYDTDHQISRMNTMAHKILGFSKEEVCLPARKRIKLIQIRTKGGILPRQEELVGWRALHGEVVINYEMLLKPKGKEEFATILTSAAPIRTPDGKIIGAIQTLSDISEMKRSEQALRESEEKFSKAFFGNPGFMFITEAENGRFIEVNEAYCSILGYQREEMLGRTSMELGILDPESRKQIMQASLSQGGIRNLEAYIKTKSGETRNVLFSMGLMNLGGTPSFIGSGFDITKLKRAESAVRKNEMLLQKILEVLPVGVFISDETGKLIKTNAAAELLWGGIKHVTLDQLYDYKGWWKDSGKRVDEWAFSRAFSKGEISVDEVIDIECFDGSSKTILNFAAPIRNEEGRVISAVAASMDITEHERLAEELRRSNVFLEERVRERTIELEQANRAKDQFLANMSHEIRTPMSGVLGMTEILLHQELPANVQDDLAMVRNSADSVMTLINDLFDLSRISQGKFDFHPEEFDLRSMVQDAIRPFEFQAHSKDFNFSVSFDESVPSQILCDKNRLGQVIKNLVSNAIKFTEHGFVRVHVHADKNDEDTLRLNFTVADSGMGIPRNKQKEVFSAFTQLDPSYSKKFAGMGLGLAICKSLVEGMGGEISVDSTKGKGATFRFHVTCGIVTEELEPTAPSITLKDLPPMTILIAEDNAVNRLFLRRALVTAGHKVGEAENGRHALAKVKETHFDLVLMDIQMPEMDGVEAMQRIRSGKHGRADIPIIALTAYAMKGDREKFLENGMNGYVTKPVNFEELARVITEVCGVEKIQATGLTSEKAPGAKR